MLGVSILPRVKSRSGALTQIGLEFLPLLAGSQSCSLSSSLMVFMGRVFDWSTRLNLVTHPGTTSVSKLLVGHGE